MTQLNMLKVFNLKSLACCLALLIGGALLPASVKAQFLAWNYVNILDEVRESGSRPDMEIDGSGNIHITYWQAIEDKLIYSFQNAQGDWVKEYVDLFSSNGYVNEMTLYNGVPHIVYMENVNGTAQYRYAYRVGPGNWVLDPIPGDPVDGWGGYGANAPTVASNRLQHGADILIKADGTPQVIFFDAWMQPNAFPACSNSSFYDLQMMQATKFNGQWLVRSFGEVPDLLVSCGTNAQPFDLPLGDRYGEYPNLIRRADGSFEAYTMSKFNNHILQFETQLNDTIWASAPIDSLRNRLDSASWHWSRRFYTFNGLSATVDNQDNVHLAYSSSFNYGDNFFALEFINELVYTRVVGPDSIYDYSFGTSGSYTYRNYTDLATIGPDSIYLVYADLSLSQLLMWESQDSGQTWTQDTIANLIGTCQSPVRVSGDSLLVLYYNSASDNLNLARRHLAGGDWTYEQVTTTQRHGQSLDGAVVEMAADTMGHLAFNNGNNGDLFYASASASGGWNYTIDTLDGSGGNALAVSVVVGPNDVPVIAYSGGDNGDARLATWSGTTWQYEIVDTAVNATFTDLAISAQDTLHFVYYDEVRNCLQYRSRHFNDFAWSVDTIDCDSQNVGQWPSLALEGEIPHVAYYDDTGFQLKYAVRDVQTRVWEIDTVNTRIPSAVGKYCSLKLTSQGEPKIAYLDEANTAIVLSEKSSSGIWEHTVVDSSQVSNIGRPTELQIDQFDNVWIAYNFNFNFDRAKLMHRDSIWREVAVGSQGQIADEFHFDIIGGDLFLMGRKTELQNTGLGMLYAPQGLFVYEREPFDLSQIISWENYPNPFTGETTFRLSLDEPEVLSLKIYDLNGKTIATLLDHQKTGSGVHEISWNAQNVPPGIYLGILNNGNSQAVKKLVVTN